MVVRDAEEADLDRLAHVWHQGWHEAHGPVVPAELTRLRTLESFRARLEAALPATRVVGPRGAAVGFHVVKDDELNQLYVAPEARGAGVANALRSDAEERLRQHGIETAWLACAIGNNRAARFYEKCGWRRVGTILNEVETSEGPFQLEVWRYEKHLTARAPASRETPG